MSKIKDDRILKFKIQMKYLSPPVWRTVLVPADLTFHQFHEVIQVLFKWRDYHLYSFLTEDSYIEIPPKEKLFAKKESIDSREKKLNEYFKNKDEKISYTYDFGDSWEHIVMLKDILNKKEKKEYPVCIDGKGKAPPEDCGGPPGFERMKEILSDSEHEEYEHMKQWAGNWEEIQSYDKKDINELLSLLKEEDYKLEFFKV